MAGEIDDQQLPDPHKPTPQSPPTSRFLPKPSSVVARVLLILSLLLACCFCSVDLKIPHSSPWPQTSTHPSKPTSPRDPVQMVPSCVFCEGVNSEPEISLLSRSLEALEVTSVTSGIDCFLCSYHSGILNPNQPSGEFPSWS